MSDDKKPFNPFKATWNVISTISGAIGLVSIADDLYAWHNFFDQLLVYYRNIVHWPFEWIPFEIPGWIKDYILISAILFFSYYKAVNRNDPKNLKSLLNVDTIAIILISIPLTPILFLILLCAYIPYRLRNPKLEESILQPFKITGLYFGAILLIFLACLITSIVLKL